MVSLAGLWGEARNEKMILLVDEVDQEMLFSCQVESEAISVAI